MLICCVLMVISVTPAMLVGADLGAQKPLVPELGDGGAGGVGVGAGGVGVGVGVGGEDLSLFRTYR